MQAARWDAEKIELMELANEWKRRAEEAEAKVRRQDEMAAQIEKMRLVAHCGCEKAREPWAGHFRPVYALGGVVTNKSPGVPGRGERSMRQTAESRHLPVKLTEEEVAEKAQELAESVAREEEMREAFAAWKSTMDEAAKAKKAGIYLAHADTVHLGEVVETGIEERLVDCTWLYSKTAAYLRRDDTGELVQVRELREDERQAVIGEAEVVQVPAQEKAGSSAEIRFPAEREMETFIRESFRR
jgi:hypothetical protein